MNANQIVKSLENKLTEIRATESTAIKAAKAELQQLGWVEFDTKHRPPYESYFLGTHYFVSPELYEELKKFLNGDDDQDRYNAWVEWEESSLPWDEYNNPVHGEWENHWVEFPR